MPVNISNPGLLEIARRIMSEPGFSFDPRGMERAFRRWTEVTTPEQREVAEKVFFYRWMEDLRAEKWRPAIAAPTASPGRPRVVPGRVAEDSTPPERDTMTAPPVSSLKFRSESPGWPRVEPSPPAAAPSAPVPLRQAPPAPPAPAPVAGTGSAVQSAAEHVVPPPSPAPMTQPSRKVAGYQQMYPELTRSWEAASGARKTLADFDERDIQHRDRHLSRQQQMWRTENAGDEQRVEDRERRNAQDRVRIAQRAQGIRDLEAERERLALAGHEMAEHGCATIGELPPEALTACGFRRQVA